MGTLLEKAREEAFDHRGKEDYGVLLATQKIDASQGKLFSKGVLIPVQNRDVTILIGLGGTGCRMLDYIKGQLSRRLQPGWENRIIFLALDTDDNERIRAANLVQDEWIILEDKNDSLVQKLKQQVPYPAAWDRIADKNLRAGLSSLDMSSTGGNGKRMMGKHKLHNKVASQSEGYDKQIVTKLSGLRNDNKTRPQAGGSYQAFVIGSSNGATCSGGFLEMPALISKALGTGAKINGMLFLPDTMTRNPDISVSEDDLMANGFATLKEFDYYMGLNMRRNYCECFGYNDAPLNNRLLMGTVEGALQKEKFFDAPYLIGTIDGPAADSLQKAEETVCEFLLSILGSHSAAANSFPVDSFQSNVSAKAMVRSEIDQYGNLIPGNRVNCPKNYGAIGYAESTVPKRLVRVYMVGEACEKMAIKAVEKDRWASTLAEIQAFDEVNTVTPFRALDCPMSEAEGLRYATDIIEPLSTVLKTIVYEPRCSLKGVAVPGTAKIPAFTWENVVTGEQKYISGTGLIKRTEEAFTKYHTSTSQMDEMQRMLRAAYRRYRENVQTFVQKHGPYAFVNLYNGVYEGRDGGNALGIKAMIKNIVAGKNPDGTEYDFLSSEKAQKKLDAICRTILHPKGIERIWVGLGVGGRRQELLLDWRRAQENVITAKTNEARRKLAIEDGTLLSSTLLNPANELCTSLEIFGHILDTLAGAYAELGKSVNSFAQFQNAGDNASEVNLGAVNLHTYNWLKTTADKVVDGVQARNRRNRLVEHFFENTRAWMDIPEGCIAENINTHKYELVKPDVAIPARQIFDELMATEILPNMISVDIETLFSNVAQDSTARADFASQIVTQLAQRSMPLFHGSCNPEHFHRILMYPASLLTSVNGGPEIAEALEAAARSHFGQQSVQIVSSKDTDSIRMYQYVGSLELYRLSELADWERKYEAALNKDSYGYFMHGYSPSLIETDDGEGRKSFVETRPWTDYPSPCAYFSDPRTTPDPQFGTINREGRRRLKIDETIRKARELGLLFSEQVNNKWRIYFAKPDPRWNLDLDDLETGDDGYYPSGKALLKKLVEQNNTSFDSIVKLVQLEAAGFLSGNADTEKAAWRFATETLYAHIPMLDELEKAIPWMEERTQKVQELNKKRTLLAMPGYFVHILRAGLIFEENDRWYMKTENGRKALVNMDPLLLSDLPERFQKLFAQKLRFAYIYKKILANKSMSSELYLQLAKQALEAKDALDERINDGDVYAQDEKLKVWIPRSREFEEEIACLRNTLHAEFGENPEGGKIVSVPANPQYIEEMKLLGFDRSESQVIFDFYRIAAKWKNMSMGK